MILDLISSHRVCYIHVDLVEWSNDLRDLGGTILPRCWLLVLAVARRLWGGATLALPTWLSNVLCVTPDALLMEATLQTFEVAATAFGLDSMRLVRVICT